MTNQEEKKLRELFDESLRDVIETQNGFMFGNFTDQERQDVFDKHLNLILSKLSENEERVREEIYQDAYWIVDEDEETGKHYWKGGGSGDMDESQFDVGEPLICNPEHFQVGYVVTGYDLVNSLNQKDN